MLEGIRNLFRRSTDNIVLASGSPRRKELLQQAGLTHFTVAPTDADETVPGDMPPEEVVMLLSRRKAEAACFSSREIIIAADTIVWLDGRALGKPADRAEAARMLQELSGRQHTVYTGVTLRRGEELLTDWEATQVWFRALDRREIRAYVRSEEPMDKAGGYAIQGMACSFVERIEGDYTNVIGLPMAKLAGMLRRFGVLLLK